MMMHLVEGPDPANASLLAKSPLKMKQDTPYASHIQSMQRNYLPKYPFLFPFSANSYSKNTHGLTSAYIDKFKKGAHMPNGIMLEVKQGHDTGV